MPYEKYRWWLSHRLRPKQICLLCLRILRADLELAGVGTKANHKRKSTVIRANCIKKLSVQ